MSKHQKSYLLTGFICIFLGVILGAFGAHGLEGKIPQEKINSYEVGVRYQLYHGFGFLILGLLHAQLKFSLTWAYRLMLSGLVLFSGSIYLLALQGLVGLSIEKIIGPITPVGGLLLIVSWAILIVKTVQQKVS